MNLFRQRIHLVNSKLWSKWFWTLALTLSHSMTLRPFLFLSLLSSAGAHTDSFEITQSLNWMTISVWMFNKNYCLYYWIAHSDSPFFRFMLFPLFVCYCPVFFFYLLCACANENSQKLHLFVGESGREREEKKFYWRTIQVDIARNVLCVVHNRSTEFEWSAKWMKFEFREIRNAFIDLWLTVWRLCVLCRDSFRFSRIHLNFRR